MNNKSEQDKNTLSAEDDNAFKAISDVEEKGFTERKCLLCGGELIVTIVDNSSMVECKKENRVILRLRGI